MVYRFRLKMNLCWCLPRIRPLSHFNIGYCYNILSLNGDMEMEGFYNTETPPPLASSSHVR